MSVGLVSGNYRKLEPSEVPEVAARLDAAWKHEAIPSRQWISVVRGEIERYRNGEYYQHFDALIRALRLTGLENPTLLEVGASSGFYSEILKIGGFDCRYTALDYSEAYQRMAAELFPSVPFRVGDARALPCADGEFEIVVSGCVLIHVYEYEKVIAESARVASKYVVMNRTPVTGQTTFFEKTAYNVPCLEVWLGEDELLSLFRKYGLELVSQQDTHTDQENHYAQRTYLLKKR